MAKLDYSVGATSKEIVMTPNKGVEDDQLGQYYRRVGAIADRLGKSLSFKDVMETLQRIHDGEFGQLGVPLEPRLDFIVRVDRSIKPNYPDWAKKVMHPELELAGPSEYDLSQIDQWLHNDQKLGVVVGNTIYKYLGKNNALTTCLNLQDGLAIQKKGIVVFRKLFTSKIVSLWGSVVRDSGGDLRVPYLVENNGRVVVDWGWLDSTWGSDNPSLRISK